MVDAPIAEPVRTKGPAPDAGETEIVAGLEDVTVYEPAYPGSAGDIARVCPTVNGCVENEPNTPAGAFADVLGEVDGARGVLLLGPLHPSSHKARVSAAANPFARYSMIASFARGDAVALPSSRTFCALLVVFIPNLG
jgi:hypothetical protein